LLFQSGGNYDLKLNAACDTDALHDGEQAAALFICAVWLFDATHLPVGLMPRIAEVGCHEWPAVLRLLCVRSVRASKRGVTAHAA
jgi:hypothetical protein